MHFWVERKRGGKQEQREREEGLDESCKKHVQKWENYFDQLQTCAAGFGGGGGGGMMKTSVLSKENPLHVTRVELVCEVFGTNCSFIPTILMSIGQI